MQPQVSEHLVFYVDQAGLERSDPPHTAWLGQLIFNKAQAMRYRKGTLQKKTIFNNLDFLILFYVEKHFACMMGI